MSQRRLEHPFITALSVWVLVSLAASAIARSSPLLGLAAAGVGGIVVGLLSAQRVNARRVKVRRHRHRPAETSEA